ncbi:hypothetical protein HN011_005648 [Eciton burchellii]|nr:hypothetical protein HN011_005648 [Eciton burchellii]
MSMRCRRRLTPSSVPFLGPHSATRRLTGVLARMTIDSRADQATFAATRLRESRVPPTTTTTTTTTTTMTTTTTTATATAIDSIQQTFVIPPSTRPPMIDDRKRRFALSFGLSFVDSTRCSTPARACSAWPVSGDGAFHRSVITRDHFLHPLRTPADRPSPVIAESTLDPIDPRAFSPGGSLTYRGMTRHYNTALLREVMSNRIDG